MATKIVQFTEKGNKNNLNHLKKYSTAEGEMIY